MIWKEISKEQTLYYKGIGILLIVLHNYFHSLSPLPGENEFDFSSERINLVISILLDNPEDFIRLFFTYMGHFGVQVFIFLSAYGLAKSYPHSTISYRKFITKRILTIYPAFLLSILFFILYTGIPYGYLGPLKVMYWTWDELLLKVFAISNLVPSMALKPIGPWWFISFIVQFYLVFPVITKWHKKYGNNSLIAIAISGIIIDASIYQSALELGVNTKQNLIGHLPEICLGVYLANQKSININSIIILLALIIFIAGNYFLIFWPFTFLCALILMIACIPILPSHDSLAGELFKYLGRISMQLFLINAVVRNTFVELTGNESSLVTQIEFSLLYLAAIIASAHMLFMIEKKSRELVYGRIINSS